MSPKMEAPELLCRKGRARGNKLTVDIRPLDAMDRAFLAAMLFEAFFWDPARLRPPLAEFREHPEFTKLLADWVARETVVLSLKSSKPKPVRRGFDSGRPS